jgi:hypothetical protein
MTETALAIVIACLIGLIGLGLLLLNVDRGVVTVSGGGFNIRGGVGLILLVLGFGSAGYLFYHPASPDKCLFLCPVPPPPPPPPPPPVLTPKPFNFPAQDTRAGDGKSGSMSDIHVTLLPPDTQHPLGQFIATWLYTGSGGSQGGSQSVNVRMKGKGDVDLPSPPPLPLDRGGCHYGGVRQTFQQDLKTPFDSIDRVELQPGIAEGKVGKC